jgi:hypothetical protein
MMASHGVAVQPHHHCQLPPLNLTPCRMIPPVSAHHWDWACGTGYSLHYNGTAWPYRFGRVGLSSVNHKDCIRCPRAQGRDLPGAETW